LAPIAVDLPFAPVAKEIVRATVAFLLFLILLASANWAGLSGSYGKAVIAVAQAIYVPTQHFPLLTRLDNLTLHNLENVVILTIALFLVSTKLDLASRISRFGSVLAGLFSYHVVAAILTIKVQTAQELLASMNILVLSPTEFHVLDWLRYLLYDVGLEITPFVMLLLTIVWNLTASRAGRERSTKRRPTRDSMRRGRRRVRAAAMGLVVIAIFSLSAVLYGRWRETDPRHVEAHAKIGHLFWNTHKDAQAEEQYRLALAGGTTDPEVFFNVAGLEARNGNHRAALRQLDEGMRITHEAVWQSRFQKAIALIKSKSL
jgi:hypothetical protein